MKQTVILSGYGPRIHTTSGTHKPGSILVITQSKVNKIAIKNNTDIQFAAA